MDAWVVEQFRVSSSAEEFLRPSCPMIVPRYRQLTYKYSSIHAARRRRRRPREKSHTLLQSCISRFLHCSFIRFCVWNDTTPWQTPEEPECCPASDYMYSTTGGMDTTLP